MLAVATVEDAIKLREARLDTDILMMSSTCIEEDIRQLIENNIIITLGSEMSIKAADEIAKKLQQMNLKKILI